MIDHVWLHVKSDAQIVSFYRCGICRKPMKSVIDARMHVLNAHDISYAKAAKSIENLQDEMGDQFLGEFRVCFPQLAERLDFAGPSEFGGESSFSIGPGISNSNDPLNNSNTQNELRVMRFTL